MYTYRMTPRSTARRIPVRRIEQKYTRPYNEHQIGEDVSTLAPDKPGQAKPTISSAEPNQAETAAAHDVIESPPVPEETDWRAVALRAQADMENFRQRQVRRADEAIAAERERLLRQILPVADNLQRALNHQHQDETSLQEGVSLVLRQLMQVLEGESARQIEAVDQPFDPNLHEAVATALAPEKSGLVLEEIEPGYMLGDKLLRPARVVVAT